MRVLCAPWSGSANDHGSVCVCVCVLTVMALSCCWLLEVTSRHTSSGLNVAVCAADVRFRSCMWSLRFESSPDDENDDDECLY